MTLDSNQIFIYTNMSDTDNFSQERQEVNLVNLVYDYPELYDIDKVCYRDRVVKENAWQKVAQGCGMSVERCKLKWKNLRTSYSRSKVSCKSKSGDAAKSTRPYYLSQHLEFLDPFMKNTRSPDNSVPLPRKKRALFDDSVNDNDEEENSDRDEHLPLPSKIECDLPERLQAISPNSGTSTAGSSTRKLPQTLPPGARRCRDGSEAGGSSGRRSKSMLDPFEHRMLDMMEKRTNNDEDRHFALSLVPTLQQLSAQNKAAVKIQIQQLLYNIQFGQPASPPQQPHQQQ